MRLNDTEASLSETKWRARPAEWKPGELSGAYLSSDSGSRVFRLWMWLTGELLWLVFSSLLTEWVLLFSSPSLIRCLSFWISRSTLQRARKKRHSDGYRSEIYLYLYVTQTKTLSQYFTHEWMNCFKLLSVPYSVVMSCGCFYCSSVI